MKGLKTSSNVTILSNDLPNQTEQPSSFIENNLKKHKNKIKGKDIFEDSKKNIPSIISNLKNNNKRKEMNYHNDNIHTINNIDHTLSSVRSNRIAAKRSISSFNSLTNGTDVPKALFGILNNEQLLVYNRDGRIGIYNQIERNMIISRLVSII